MKNNQIVISVAKDFSEYPGARYRTDGDHSGEEFYEEILKPLLTKIWDNEKVILIDFDGTFGYASSFISEIFIRVVEDFKDKKKIKKKLKFKSEDEPLLLGSIEEIIDES
jgi:hypothetical protein